MNVTPMCRAEKEVTDPAWCRALFDEAPYLMLALNDGGAPYVVPLCVALAGGGIYLHMAAAGRKLDLLLADPRAGFAAVAHAAVVPGATACATGMRASSVAGTARCAVVDDPGERRSALDAFARKYTGAVPDGYPEAALDAMVVVRLDPISITGRRTG
ncbi:MAG TPA: pyridoxamine 5'-phosphate oxidase family protein [Methanoregulaceae archaeon]|nr:pyridoxamine 5'-phosphate oxidase family protein [Methanoregulaceae archaeon]